MSGALRGAVRDPVDGMTSSSTNMVEEPHGIDCDVDSVIELDDYPSEPTIDTAAEGVNVVFFASVGYKCYPVHKLLILLL